MSTNPLDPDCICHGNWRSIIKEYQDLYDRKFVEERSGLIYTFCGIVHASDDYYYLMWREKDMRLVTCVGSLTQCGFILLEEEVDNSVALL